MRIESRKKSFLIKKRRKECAGLLPVENLKRRKRSESRENPINPNRCANNEKNVQENSTN